MLLLAMPALAVEVVRPPEPDETAATIVVDVDAKSWVLDRQSDRASRQRYERQRLAVLDMVVRGQAQAMASCPPGEVDARIRVGTDGRARATPVRGATPELARCVEAAFSGVPLPAVVWKPLSATYTFRVSAGETAPAPVDRDGGWLGVRFGARPADVPGLTSPASAPTATTMYGRVSDRGRMFGQDPLGVAYAFADEEGFYAAMTRFDGFAAKFGVHQALEARFGPPRMDPVTRAPYWRGEHTVVQLLHDGDIAVLIVMDAERAVTGRHVDRLPGDPAR